VLVSGRTPQSATSAYVFRVTPTGLVDVTTAQQVGLYPLDRPLVVPARGGAAITVATIDANLTQVTRTLPSGRLDSRFGRRTVEGARVVDAAVDRRGRVVLLRGPSFPSLVRLTPTGAVDSSFGSGGSVALPGDPDHGAEASALAIDRRGRILVAGRHITGDPTPRDCAATGARCEVPSAGVLWRVLG
jgi:hypothetical protein